jgi:hypothetical protein
MRRLMMSLAAAGTALAFATPAAAQYYPQQQQQQPYGYGNGYGYNNGYTNGYNNYGQVRVLRARIDAVQNQIRYLGRGYGGRDNSADRLRDEARNLERRLHQASRFGLNPYEVNDIQRRIAVLEQRVQYASTGRYGRGGYGYNNDRGNGFYGDRDRDDRGSDRDDDR